LSATRETKALALERERAIVVVRMDEEREQRANSPITLPQKKKTRLRRQARRDELEGLFLALSEGKGLQRWV